MRTLWAAVLVVASTAVYASESEAVKHAQHARFYGNAAGRSAEFACSMRHIQRLNQGPVVIVRSWFREGGMEDLRVVLMSAIDVWAKVKADAQLNSSKDQFDKLLGAFANKNYPQAAVEGPRLLEIVKANRGANDPLYADVLELVGEAKAFQRQHDEALAVYLSVLELRRKAKPASDSKAAYEARVSLARIMSKAADRYWILAKDPDAARLRSDANTLYGDERRIADIDMSDQLASTRTPIDPKFPSCVDALLKRVPR